MSSDIFRIILDDLALLDDLADLSSADHALQPVHLPQCVGKKKVPLLSRLTNPRQ